MPGRKTSRRPLSDKTCKQIADLVYGYVNNQLTPRRKREFEQHLEICPDCISFLRTYQKTVQATGALDVAAMPGKVRQNILTFLRKRLHRLASTLLLFVSQLFA